MIYYCCDSMRRLDRMGYVGDHKIYLQRCSVPSTLPIDLRGYRYCIACGVDVKKHPSNIAKPNGNIRCTMLAEGLLNENIVHGQTDTISSNENAYSYNLNTRDEVTKWSKQNINYPQSVRIDYCPYCGYAHISDHASVHNENLFVLAEYWI